MASRRDELNAYTFAKKRLVAAFLQPTPSGTEEHAPRPLRAVVPGLIVGVVIMAVFGAWGMFKPKAPEGWDEPGKHVIIGSESTTRYVVLKTGDGPRQLHPVLNMASAKLLLKPGEYEIVEVDEKVLDSGKIPHGATLGIPYAPDRLPGGKEAEKQKTWAVCTQQGGGEAQKAVFLFAERERGRVHGRNRLGYGQVMYVQDPDGGLHVVDHTGTAYPVDNNPILLSQVVGDDAEPQEVTKEWMDTLRTGDPIRFPTPPARLGQPANVDRLDARVNKIGMVLEARIATGMQHYVVLAGEVRPISDLMATLLLTSPATALLGQNARAEPVSRGTFDAESRSYGAHYAWPKKITGGAVNAPAQRDTLCNVMHGAGAKAEFTTWVGKDYPATLPNGASSAYVTPGSGLLFRQYTGRNTKDGGVFLVTDTGLKYAVQSNADSGQDDSGIGSGGEKDKQQDEAESRKAEIRLGYEDTEPVSVSAAWARLLPTGPRLSTGGASQPQGS